MDMEHENILTEEQEQEQTQGESQAGEQQEQSQEGQQAVQPEGHSFLDGPREAMAPEEDRQSQSQSDEGRQLAQLMDTLRGLGYSGQVQDICDQIEAGRQDITVEEVRRQRQQQQDQVQQALHQHPDYLQAQAELAVLRQRESQRLFEADLAAVKKLNPEEKATDVRQLGEDFIRLRAAGVSVEAAYQASRAAVPQVQPPPDAGAVQTGEAAQGQFFTKEQVQAMSREEVQRNLSRIEESMKNW